MLARTLAEGSTVRREDLAFLREVAARRVHQGVTLDEFIHAYRVALLAYWDACADEAARVKISRATGFALASSAIEAIDVITTQAAEAYLREETRLRTRLDRAERREDALQTRHGESAVVAVVHLRPLPAAILTVRHGARRPRR